MNEGDSSEEIGAPQSIQIHIKNFKSIKNGALDVSPLTILYGENGAGKSSALYALLTLKNIIINSNQNVNGFFNYPFLNAGGYENIVFDHQKNKMIELEIEASTSGLKVTYGVEFDESKAKFMLDAAGKEVAPRKLSLDLPTTFPYQLNQQRVGKLNLAAQKTLDIVWNGVISSVSASVAPEMRQEANDTIIQLNSPVELIRKIGFVPLKRGFSKPLYSTGASVTSPVTEDEIASLLVNDKYLVSRISHYIERIFNRDFRVSAKPGTGFFSLDLTDRQTGLGTELINDGFGINQTVHLLSVALFDNYSLILIEEPEIHLNPSAIKKLVGVLVEIAKKKHKRFIISTHSESLITSLLAAVADARLKNEDLAVYLVEKSDDVSKFSRQEVNENGQIKDGLAQFVEAELSDLRSFLKVPD